MRFPRYALHVAKATGYGHEGLAVGLALMARYAVATGRGVTPLSMHRLFATCMQLGMKTASDRFLKNVYVAPLVGMALAELNTLEADLAAALGFGALATAAELTRLPEALAALPPGAPTDDVQRVFAAHAHGRTFTDGRGHGVLAHFDALASASSASDSAVPAAALAADSTPGCHLGGGGLEMGSV